VKGERCNVRSLSSPQPEIGAHLYSRLPGQVV